MREPPGRGRTAVDPGAFGFDGPSILDTVIVLFRLGAREVELPTLFREFERYAFRLETLTEYDVPEEAEALAGFRRTGRIPLNVTASWAEIVRPAVASGRSVRRLRLLSREPTEYERFELLAYRLGVESGEDIRIVERHTVRPVPDFWLFDGVWIARMEYSSAGAFLGAQVERLADPDEVTPWLARFDQVAVTPRDYWSAVRAPETE